MAEDRIAPSHRRDDAGRARVTDVDIPAAIDYPQQVTELDAKRDPHDPTFYDLSDVIAALDGGDPAVDAKDAGEPEEEQPLRFKWEQALRDDRRLTTSRKGRGAPDGHVGRSGRYEHLRRRRDARGSCGALGAKRAPDPEEPARIRMAARRGSTSPIAASRGAKRAPDPEELATGASPVAGQSSSASVNRPRPRQTTTKGSTR
jgi:hypothetical protein